MTNLPDKRMIEFIREHHILTVAVSRDNIPWCATCYYAYNSERNQFIFTSEPATRHVRDMVEGDQFQVAGAIALETRIVGKIRGIQFSGKVWKPGEEMMKVTRAAYLKRFPIARLMPELHLWILEPDYLKMTDNRLGFGTKLIWTSSEEERQA